MKCPLFQLASIAGDRVLPNPQADCLQAECAWWSVAGSHCVIFEMAIDMNNLAEQLEHLNDGIRLIK